MKKSTQNEEGGENFFKFLQTLYFQGELFLFSYFLIGF